MTKQKDSSNPMLLHLFHRSRSTKKMAASYNFPQPTRPEDVSSPKPPCTPPYPPWEFSHPSTAGVTLSPSNRSRPSTPSSYLKEIGYPRFVPERWFQNDDDDDDSSEEGYEEIIGQIMDLYEKLPGKVKEKVSMELIRNIVGNRINVNIAGGSTNGQPGFNVGSSTTSRRGLDRVESPSPHRLERFKVKTIKVGGVSTSDDDKARPKFGMSTMVILGNGEPLVFAK